MKDDKLPNFNSFKELSRLPVFSWIHMGVVTVQVALPITEIKMKPALATRYFSCFVDCWKAKS